MIAAAGLRRKRSAFAAVVIPLYISSVYATRSTVRAELGNPACVLGGDGARQCDPGEEIPVRGAGVVNRVGQPFTGGGDFVVRQLESAAAETAGAECWGFVSVCHGGLLF